MTRASTVARSTFCKCSRTRGVPGTRITAGVTRSTGTLRGTIWQGTPLITTVPYVYEALRDVYQVDQNDRWRQIMRSIAEHGFSDYKDFPTSERASSCSYSPIPEQSVGVVNANAYRAFLLTQAAMDFSEDRY